MKKILCICLFAGLFIYTSCSNLFENSVNKESSSRQKSSKKQTELESSEVKYATLSGTFDTRELTGALPSRLLSLVNASGEAGVTASGRSAKPSLPVTSDYEYYIKALSPENKTIEKAFSISDGLSNYSIALPIDIKWTFKAGLRSKADKKQLLLDSETLAGKAFSKTFSDTKLNETHSFILQPLTDGKGSIKLMMKKVPADVKELKILDSSGKNWLNGAVTIGLSISDDNENYIKASDVKPGIYDVTFIFYREYSGLGNIKLPAYISYQTISVFANMETDTWVRGNTSSADQIINSSGEFELTDTLISSFMETTLYVGKPSQLVSGAQVANPDDSNAGTPYAPLKNLEAAFKHIEASKKGTAYQIFISGEQKKSGGFVIPDGITNTVASSITISGLGSERAVLNADNDDSVLKVKSTIPVTLKNIQLIGGKAVNGGGIYMESGTKVTLEAGTLIGDDTQENAAGGEDACANFANAGGGVYTKGELILKNDSTICYNYALDSQIGQAGGGIFCCETGSVKLENGALISKNAAQINGGGIAVAASNVSTVSVEITGGEISGNEAGEFGAGIYVQKGNVSFTSGEIKGNSITGTGNGGGAGIHIEDSATHDNVVNMSGTARITGNTGSTFGGGVGIQGGSLIMTGGEISENETPKGLVDGNNHAPAGGAVCVCGNGSFKMGGTATIPYGKNNVKEPGKNDIYLDIANNLKITLTSDITNHDESSLAVSVSDARRGKTIVDSSNGLEITDTIRKKFLLTYTGSSQNAEGFETKLVTKESVKEILLDSPFYINETNGRDEDGYGKLSAPYKTIKYACEQMDDKNVDYTIKIAGELTAAQEIPSTLGKGDTDTHKAKSVTIEGYNSGLINRGLTEKPQDGSSDTGRALEIKGTSPVYIKNLTIKGGYSKDTGGGIQMNSNTELHIESGTVIENNKAHSGAGIYNYNGTLYITDGEIKNNSTTGDDANGGGIYNNQGKLYITGGTISANSAHFGGAIFVYSNETEISGNATIEKGRGTDSSPLNDICLWNYKLKIPSDLKKHDSTSKQIALRVSNTVAKGASIIEGNGVASAYGKFALVPTGFKFDSDGKLQLKTIVTSIYVKEGTISDPGIDPLGDTKNDSTWNNYDYSYNSDSYGSRDKPFKSIDKALQFITYQNSKSNYTINISGTINGQVNIKADNSDSNNPIKLVKNTNAVSITIQGSKLEDGIPKDEIKANVGSNSIENGQAVYINTGVPVIFKKLSIYGGKNTGNGGGICIDDTSSDVTLGEYTFIDNNSAKYGAGIYNKGTLTVKQYAKIYSNTRSGTGGAGLGGGGIYNTGTVKLAGGEICKNDSSSYYGGGIYNTGNIFVYGGATIGASENANSASYGGGIYNRGYLYFGYTEAKTDKTPNVPNTNKTSSWSGKIQYNKATSGAGIYNEANSYVYLNTGTITANSIGGAESTAQMGMGVYTAGTFIMTGGTITENANTSKGGKGGGVYISESGTFDIQGSSNTQKGVVSLNTVNSSGDNKGYGGGIYNAGTLKVSGYASISNGTESNNDIYLPSQKVVTVGSLSGNHTVGGITLANWYRGTPYLYTSTNISSCISRFTLTLNDANWTKEAVENNTKAIINSPIYVKNGGSSTGLGLSSDMVTIFRALELIKNANNSSLAYNIVIDGEISNFTMPGGNNSLDGKAASITIKGKSSTYGSDKIKADGAAGDGNVALVVNTSVPVTLQNIKITGGNNSYTYSSTNTMGGGISVGSSANVTLSDGVLVTGNYASTGAGVFNAGTLTVTGSASSDNQCCVISYNNTNNTNGDSDGRRGGGIYNKGTLHLEGYAKLTDNYAFKEGGAIYNNGTLEMKGNIEIPDGSQNDNDIFVVTNKPIKIKDSINSNGMKITASRSEGITLIEKAGDLSQVQFKNTVGKFSMSTKDTILLSDDGNYGILGLDLVVTALTQAALQAALDRVTANGDRIVIRGEVKDGFVTNTLPAVLNNSSYKVHLDFTQADYIFTSEKFDGISKVSEISINAKDLINANRITNMTNLTKINIYGNIAPDPEPDYGFGNTNLLTNIPQLEEIVFVDAETVFIENGIINYDDSTTSNDLIIRLPSTISKIYIQDRFNTPADFTNIKIVFGGSLSSLKAAGKVARAPTNPGQAWKTVNGGIKLYYNNSTSSYSTWTPAANSASGSWAD